MTELAAQPQSGEDALDAPLLFYLLQRTLLVREEERKREEEAEEEESVAQGFEELCSQRFTLFFLDTGSAEWKERGLGKARLLKRRCKGKVRFVIHDEKKRSVIPVSAIVAPPYCVCC